MSDKQPLETRLPRYVPEVVRKLSQSPPQKDEVQHITIYHDDWCDQLQGLGMCNCDFVVGNPVKEV